jgi:hypothetical protein
MDRFRSLGRGSLDRSQESRQVGFLRPKMIAWRGIWTLKENCDKNNEQVANEVLIPMGIIDASGSRGYELGGRSNFRNRVRARNLNQILYKEHPPG